MSKSVRYGGVPKMVGFPNNHWFFLLKIGSFGGVLGVPPFSEHLLGTIYDTMSALCASHSLSAKDLGCVRHAARCAIVKPITSSCFFSPGMVLTTPHRKTAEENVKKSNWRHDGRFISHIKRLHGNFPGWPVNPFSSSPATQGSRCLQPPLQGAEMIPYRDWHSVHDLELPCHWKRAGIAVT